MNARLFCGALISSLMLSSAVFSETATDGHVTGLGRREGQYEG
jgi:hypothetical protein